MASYVPVVKNGANGAILYIGLVDQSNTKLLKSSPTLATGDFKVSIDGGALANLGTLPTVTPAAGRQVKITLSQAEVNGDNITIQCIDAAGAEWCDLLINIQTTARQIDDLAFPVTSGRGVAVDANNLVAVPATQKVDVDTIKTNPVVNGGTITFPTTATLASTTNLTAGTIATVSGNVNGSVGSVTGAVGSVTGAVGSLTANNDKTGYALSATGSAALTESYAADGAAMTLNQAIYQIWSFLAEKNVAGTTLTAKKLDGSTTSMTFTLDSSSAPTSITRAT